jgi:hypothetical protein
MREAFAEDDPLLKLVRDVAVKVNESSSMRDVLGFALSRLCEYSGWEAAIAYRRESGDGYEEQVLQPLAGYYAKPAHAAFHDEVMKRTVPLEVVLRARRPRPSYPKLTTEPLVLTLSSWPSASQ